MFEEIRSFKQESFFFAHADQKYAYLAEVGYGSYAEEEWKTYCSFVDSACKDSFSHVERKDWLADHDVTEEDDRDGNNAIDHY